MPALCQSIRNEIADIKGHIKDLQNNPRDEPNKHDPVYKPVGGEINEQRGLLNKKIQELRACEKGAIDQKYNKLGGPEGVLGSSTTEVLPCPDGVGVFRHYQNGSIYMHPKTGVCEVHGLIRDKWAKLGWEKSFLGYPVSDETTTPDGIGRYNHFQGGSIYWHPDVGTFEVHGAIREKWASLGWEKGFLGYPVTDETVTPDGVGRYNHFQNGSIYWKSSISAHEVHGLIKGYWADHGWEQNLDLGYPISDELPTKANSKNCYNDFENGVVFWKYGEKNASILSKVTLDNASKTAAEVVGEINKIIVPMIKASSEVYIKSGPSLSEVTDYFFDGNIVHNRKYKIHVAMGVDVPVFSDATIDLDMWIEITLDKQAKKIQVYMVEYYANIHVPGDTHSIAGVDASDIKAKIKQALDPHIWKPYDVKDISTLAGGINILSLKVMPNGDLNIYIEPLI